jgi:aspartate ammonia-lyase
MTNAINMMTERCIRSITANVDRCECMVRDSIGIVTAFNPFISYEKSSMIAQKALATGRGVVELIQEEELLDAQTIKNIMEPENLTGPSSLLSEKNLKNVDRSHTHLRKSSALNSDFLTLVFQDNADEKKSP